MWDKQYTIVINKDIILLKDFGESCKSDNIIPYLGILFSLPNTDIANKFYY